MRTICNYTYDNEISLDVLAEKNEGSVNIISIFLDNIDILPIVSDNIIFDITLYLEMQSINEE